GRLDEAPAVTAMVARVAPAVPVITAVHVPTECLEASGLRLVPTTTLPSGRLMTFAGIGSPTRFRRTLQEAMASVVDFREFPDHHWYTREDLARLERDATELDAHGFVTTEKDWVRLRPLPPLKRPLYVLSVRLTLT